MKSQSLRRALTIGSIAGVSAVSLSSATTVGLAAFFARKVVTPASQQPNDATVLAVHHDQHGVVTSAVFAPTVESLAPGRYGLYWDEDAGHARIGEIAGEDDAGNVIRTVDAVTRGELKPGPARWSSYYFDGSPQDAFALPTETVVLETESGDAPAWVTRAGDGRRWAVLVHGRGARRGETLRAVPVLNELGISTIIPTYRNDPDGPRSLDGRYGLGLTEWQDVDLAVRYALDQGATRIDLLGWSMGGAIVMQLANRSEYAEHFGKIVLDSPVLDWADVMVHHARTNKLHPKMARLAGALLGSNRGRHAVGVQQPMDLKLTNWVARADEVRHPMLVIHSVDDEFVPYEPSAALAAERPDLVTWAKWQRARHVREWNTEPERWEALVRDFLSD